MSQADLARKANLSRTTISDYEKRIRPYPAMTALTQISTALGYPEDHLPRLAGLLPPLGDEDPWVTSMSHKLGQLPPGLRSVAETVINSMLEGETASNQNKRRARTKSAKA